MMTPEPNHRATPEDRWAATADLPWMLWTAIGIGGIWAAVLLLSQLAPDLVSDQAGGPGTRLAYSGEIGADLWWAGERWCALVAAR